MSNEEHIKEFKSRFIWDRMVEQNVAATTPGPRELTDWDIYQGLIANGDISVISSNLSIIEDGKARPLGLSYEIIEIGGVRVGLFALIGGNEFVNSKPPATVQFDFEDPYQAAGNLVPILREKADIVVLMSQMSTKDTDRLLATVPGIDIAFYGQRPPFTQQARILEDTNTIVNQTSSRGQFLGQLIAIVNPQGEIIDFGSRNAPLSKEWPDQPETLEQVVSATAEADRLLAEARKSVQKDFQSSRSSERYLGAETCKRCHVEQYVQWARTPHAKAFATLRKDSDKTTEPDCTSCHVTGWKKPSGYVAQGKTPDLRNVQCEACHGPGTEHARTGKSKIRESVCLGCHTGEFGEGFDFDLYLESVRH